MTFSDACVELVKESEGCRLVAYQDAVAIWTIGFGHTPAAEREIWTQDQADSQLLTDLGNACDAVQSLVTVSLTQGQLDALTDFVFNLGAGKLKTSSLLRMLNSGQYAAVPDQLYRVDNDGSQHGWIYGGGQILPGLVTRRKREIALWNS